MKSKARANPYLFKLLIFLLLGCFLVSDSVRAITIENPLEADTFWELLDNLFNWVFNLAIFIAPIMLIVGGFYFMTAAGEPEKIRTAKRIILYTLIGLAIVICARALLELLGKIIGKEIAPPS